MTTKHWMKQSTNSRMLRTIITGRTPITTGAHRLRLGQHELGHSVTTTVDHNTHSRHSLFQIDDIFLVTSHISIDYL